MKVRLTRYGATLTASLAVFALLAAGCGDDGDEEARAVLDAYLEASEAGDAVAICELWSPWARRDAVALFGAAADADDECGQIGASLPMGTFAVETANSPNVSVSESDGDVVTFNVEGADDAIEIRRFDGEWRLNSLCFNAACETSTEVPAEAPIGG